MNAITFFLDTNIRFIKDWLEAYTSSENGPAARLVHMHPDRPVGGGYIFGIAGLYINQTGEGSGTVRSGVEFTLRPLTINRTEILVECGSSSLGHFITALQQIAQRWPESRGAIDEYLKGLGVGPAVEPEQAPSGGDGEPKQVGVPLACRRWRKNVKAYLKGLPEGDGPTLEGLAERTVLAPDTARQYSAEHKDCCFDWLTVKRTRQIPD